MRECSRVGQGQRTTFGCEYKPFVVPGTQVAADVVVDHQQSESVFALLQSYRVAGVRVAHESAVVADDHPSVDLQFVHLGREVVDTVGRDFEVARVAVGPLFVVTGLEAEILTT